MIKYTLSALLLASLIACTPTSSDVTGSFKLPKELSECSIYELISSTGKNLTVLKCPNSTVTTQSGGKSKVTVTTI